MAFWICISPKKKKGRCWFTFTPRTKVVKWLPECRSSRSGEKKASESLKVIIIRMRERTDTDVPGEEYLQAGINKMEVGAEADGYSTH